MVQRTCAIPDCDRSVVARGWCGLHYERWKRRGSPTPPPLVPKARRRRPVEVRFWEKVAAASFDECWLWTGSRSPLGYGKFVPDSTASSVPKQAHRVAYESLICQIPDGLVLDHLCKNPPCVNPWHLDPVTQAVNLLRSDGPARMNGKKTHCDRGHPFDETNTRRTNHGRECRACGRIRDRERAESRRERDRLRHARGKDARR